MSNVSSDTGEVKGSLTGYIVGYSLSLLFTLDAYMIVTRHLYSNGRSMTVLAGLAIVQLFTQLVCFLHLNRSSKARWNLVVLGFMLMVVLILVFGSLWIMQHLNYHMTTQQQIQYLRSQDNL